MVAGIRWWMWAIGAVVLGGLVLMIGYHVGRLQPATSVPQSSSVTVPVMQTPPATTPGPTARPIPA